MAFRSKSLDYRLNLPKIFAPELKFFQVDPSGVVKHSRLMDFLPRHRSDSTIAMHLNAWNFYLATLFSDPILILFRKKYSEPLIGMFGNTQSG
jgi:hypothetical protein